MRNLLWSVLLVSLLAVPAPTAAQATPERLGHLSVAIRELNASASVRYVIDPEGEGPLKRDWIFGVYGGAVSGASPLIVNVTFGATLIDQWVWAGIGWHFNTTRLKNDGSHNLTVWNPNAHASRFGLYYDMSCQCAGKLVPLPQGSVIFNYVFPADRKVEMKVPLSTSARVKGVVALGRGLESHWPNDFETVVERTESGPGKELRFSYQTPAAGKYYLVLTAETSVPADQCTDQPLGTWCPVSFEPDTSLAKVESPTLPLVLLLLTIGAVAYWRRVA